MILTSVEFELLKTFISIFFEVIFDRITANTQIYETFLFLQIYLHVDIQLFKKNVYLRILYIKM